MREAAYYLTAVDVGLCAGVLLSPAVNNWPAAMLLRQAGQSASSSECLGGFAVQTGTGAGSTRSERISCCAENLPLLTPTPTNPTLHTENRPVKKVLQTLRARRP
jgi:hypothetical protein